MKLNKTTLLQGLTGCLVLAAGTANAGFITVDNVGGIFASDTMGVASNNDFLGDLAGRGVTTYTLGTSLATNSAGTVEYFYFGKEAGYSNQFQAAGGSISYSTGFAPTYQNYFGAPLSLGSVAVAAGTSLLDFRFCAFTSPGTSGGCVTNLQNDSLRFQSAQSIAMSILDNGNSAWLLWDDSGAGPDDNHDDMLIRAVFTPTAVPEPQTLGLLGVGLLGIWLTMRRRERPGLSARS